MLLKIKHAVFFAALAFSSIAGASEYHGQVSFGGFPVPGATVTATQGTKKIATITDQGGIYSFADLADGKWKIEVEMQCFATLHAEVSIAPQTPAGKWELALLPIDQLMVHVKVTQSSILARPASAAAPKKNDAADANVNKPKTPDDVNEQAADGFLVNGSTNNAATSQYALSQAFGNTRTGSKGLYKGGVSAIFDNSSLDARPYSLSGVETPKPYYDHFTGGIAFGGPLRIPHLLPRGPDFFVGYQWTRNQTAETLSGIVPTTEERTGNLGSLSTTVYNPTTGLPYANNVVPLSSQAAALLQLFPAANLTNSSLYNYERTVLDSSHQDAMETRLDKSLGRRDQLWGSFNLQSVRAASTNLFAFVDTTDTLGINTNINWEHRFGHRIFVNSAYRFSRLRTLVAPNFENREDISGTAGITGNDLDSANWGPPALNFSSGLTSLSDANSAFNRSRTDAFSASASIYQRKHNVTVGADLRKQQHNDYFQQNPRGTFAFTGAATAGTGSTGFDLADFLIGVPDTSSIAYGNADKYFRQSVYDAYATDDWRVMPALTINAGLRWEYGAPITEVHGRLVNLDLASGFTSAAAVLGSDPVGSITGNHYPSSLVRPDRTGVEPRIGISWRPIPASTVVVRAGYGIYHDTSVYLAPALQLAQQAPLSKSLSVANSTACPLTLANGFITCSSTTSDNFAIDPNFRVGYAQTWQLSVQRDLPAALQLTATYLGVKGTHGVQQFLPNTYPIGATNPCPDCPLGFVYRTSGGNSTRHAGQLQLRRRLRSGFTASLLYTWSKSLDDDAQFGGQGHVTASAQNDGSTGATASIAQNWNDLRAERALSTFDQRQLLNLQVQYTSGEGLGGGDLLRGWRGRLVKEWTMLTKISTGSGLPETPAYLAAISGTGFSNITRPSLSGAKIYTNSAGVHLNSAAYTVPTSGQWGTAGRNSITGPGQFSLDASLARTFRSSTKYSLDARIDATNLLNHTAFSGWISTWNSSQFGAPSAANAMRSLQTTLRLRF
jgi:hypothetical protein